MHYHNGNPYTMERDRIETGANWALSSQVCGLA